MPESKHYTCYLTIQISDPWHKLLNDLQHLEEESYHDRVLRPDTFHEGAQQPGLKQQHCV